MRRNWLKIRVPVTPATADAISNFLFELGATGLVEAEEALEAYLPASLSAAVGKIRDFLQELEELGFAGIDKTIHTETIVEEDWNQAWKQNYGLTRISERILIRPSWVPAPESPPPCLIEIDPEMAFGTGTHATTSLLLQRLDEIDRPFRCGLDVGTGTGILAIAAVKLGAACMVAFDVDPVAAATAKRNTEKNDVASAVHVFAGTLDAVAAAAQFDLIMANINRSVVLALLPGLAKRLHPRGTLLLSGLLREERTQVEDALKNLGMCRQFFVLDEWLAVEAHFE